MLILRKRRTGITDHLRVNIETGRKKNALNLHETMQQHIRKRRTQRHVDHRQIVRLGGQTGRDYRHHETVPVRVLGVVRVNHMGDFVINKDCSVPSRWPGEEVHRYRSAYIVLELSKRDEVSDRC
jgi:hypothetical protein